MTHNLKDRVAQMDVEAWRASQKSSPEEVHETQIDLVSYFDTNGCNNAVSDTISPELDDLSKMFDD